MKKDFSPEILHAFYALIQNHSFGHMPSSCQARLSSAVFTCFNSLKLTIS